MQITLIYHIVADYKDILSMALTQFGTEWKIFSNINNPDIIIELPKQTAAIVDDKFYIFPTTTCITTVIGQAN
jgi:hypothetical protein